MFFAVKARADGDRARFEMSITNRSTKTLKSIRPLLCFQYHHLQGFPAANTDNFAHTFVVIGGKPVAVADLPCLTVSGELHQNSQNELDPGALL